MSSSSPKVASLTSTLLVAKGGANANGFTPRHPAPGRSGVTPRAPAHATAAAKDAKEEGQTEVSLRLDAAQLRRLRLAAAHLDQTEHSFLVAALEHYIDHVVSPLLDGHCSCLETDQKPRQVPPAIAFARQKSDLPQ
jgi:hypothetical protein